MMDNLFSIVKRSWFVLLLCLVGMNVVGQVVTGAERMDLYLPLLDGKRVAVCGNQTSMVGNVHLVDTLLAREVNIVKLFCPEHGFRGKAEAGAHIASGTDPKTGLPVISLYGKNKKPLPEQLKDVDVILFDLQDVGCRFYTYISTLHYVMEAAAESHRVKVVVLDRPNPNGYFVDGPVLDTNYRSFVGMHPVPVVYGMTIGEYAYMINGEDWLSGAIHCDLAVVPLNRYTHQSRYELPVAPSPNLPNAESIYLYPSLCFFEGTDVSVGRGTDSPFQQFGFPEMAAGDCTFQPQPIAGVSENPPCKGRICRGQYAHDHLLDTNYIHLEYLLVAYRNSPVPANFFTRASFFDKLAGTNKLRKQILAGKSEAEIRQSWQEPLKEFKKIRAKYLLYPDF